MTALFIFIGMDRLEDGTGGVTIREVSPPMEEASGDGAVPPVRGVYTQSGPGVVSVDVASSESGPGGGSGFVLDEQGHIVTNQHVVDEAENVSIEFAGGIREEAEIVGEDPSTDVAVVNVQGRTFMQPIENPFTMLDELFDGAADLPPVILVDFHCEITSEKNALGLYLDGRVSAVVGTHTHVATADERILPKGTAYLTDLGMTGPVHSVIGFDPATVLPRFINALPTRFEVGSGSVVFNGTQIDIEAATGRAVAIERIVRIVDV